MKKLIQIMCMALLVLATSWVGAADVPPAAKRLLEKLPGIEEKERTAPIRIPHKMHLLIRDPSIGTVELDLTTHEIVFSASEHGHMGVELFANERWERMGFGVVHYTPQRYPYRRGMTYKILISQKEKFD